MSEVVFGTKDIHQNGKWVAILTLQERGVTAIGEPNPIVLISGVINSNQGIETMIEGPTCISCVFPKQEITNVYSKITEELKNNGYTVS